MVIYVSNSVTCSKLFIYHSTLLKIIKLTWICSKNQRVSQLRNEALFWKRSSLVPLQSVITHLLQDQIKCCGDISRNVSKTLFVSRNLSILLICTLSQDIGHHISRSLHPLSFLSLIRNPMISQRLFDQLSYLIQLESYLRKLLERDYSFWQYPMISFTMANQMI